MAAAADPASNQPAGRRQIPVRSDYTPAHKCSAAGRMTVLSTTPLFSDLTQEELLEVDGRMAPFHAPEGHIVHHEGEQAHHYFVLATGRAKAYRSSTDGQQVVVNFLGPGDAFGGVEDLGQVVFTETVATLTSVCVLRIDSAGFHNMLREFPPVALRVIDELAAQLREARTAVTRRSTATVTQRVARELLTLGEKFGERNAQGTLIQVPLSRADLAGLTGSTTESVSRAMSRLRGEGLINSGRRWTIIRDHVGLESAAGAD